VRPAAVAARGRRTALAAQRLQAHGHPRVMRAQHGQQDVRAVGPRLPTSAARAGPDWCVGGVVAVLAAIDLAAGALERRQARGKAPLPGRRGRHETIAGGDARSIARIEPPPERLIMQRRGVTHAGRQASSGRGILEPPRPQGEWLVHTAEAVADQRVDGMAGGDEAHLRGVLGRVVHDGADATGVTPACDEAQMIQAVAAVDVVSVHRALLGW
jgi:hypothetical protein